MTASSSLAERLASTPYDAYLYAYPHKTAYGPLDPPRRLADVWRDEDKSALFLYVHVPFCEMRCGFCNLFTTPRPKEDAVRQYVDVLARQGRIVAEAIGDGATFARFAIGGGTPTILPVADLERVLDVAERTFGADLVAIPGSVETSPETCTAERMALLRRRGVDRISIGVQSFDEDESAGVNRPQDNREVFAGLDAIRAAGFPTLNLDLIYGLPEQTLATWEASLRRALEWKPEELYLYPLYVRPVTTLGRKKNGSLLRAPETAPLDRGAWDETRLAMYRLACELLRAEGYEQVTMRMFQRRTPVTAPAAATATSSSSSGRPLYCVQSDGMVGLGPGARSYTSALHYSTEWAVGARGVREILAAWLAETDEGLALARWGFALDGEEQRRRWVAYSLFVDEGLDAAAYRARFRSEVFDDLPLGELVTHACAEERGGKIVLTPLGLERSDTIGPWLYSANVQARMRSFALR